MSFAPWAAAASMRATLSAMFASSAPTRVTLSTRRYSKPSYAAFTLALPRRAPPRLTSALSSGALRP
jgi:hypothetical protein